MAAFDATTLLLTLSKKPIETRPIDPTTKTLVTNVKQRVDFLIHTLEKSRTKIIIPTPALSELLVHAGAAAGDYLSILENSAMFKIAPFCDRSAVELALMTKAAIDTGDKRSGISAIWSKLKFDRQIVAIAKVHGVTTIYTDDGDIRKLAKNEKINTVGVADLPLPPQDAQFNLLDHLPADQDEKENDK